MSDDRRSKTRAWWRPGPPEGELVPENPPALPTDMTSEEISVELAPELSALALTADEGETTIELEGVTRNGLRNRFVRDDSGEIVEVELWKDSGDE